MIPSKIELKTRYGKVETILTLVGNCSLTNEYNYLVNAEYPYSLYGNPDFYTAIDFSGGPFLAIGDELEGMRITDISEGAVATGMLIVMKKI